MHFSIDPWCNFLPDVRKRLTGAVLFSGQSLGKAFTLASGFRGERVEKSLESGSQALARVYWVEHKIQTGDKSMPVGSVPLLIL